MAGVATCFFRAVRARGCLNSDLMSTEPAQSSVFVSVLREMRRLAALGVPIVVSLAAATLIGVVDTIMIAPLGTVPLAAASVTSAVMLIFYAALYGFVSVIGVRMASAFGRRDATALTVATKTGLVAAAVGGVAGAVLMLAIKPALFILGQPPEVLTAMTGYYIVMSGLLIPFTLFLHTQGVV